MALDEVLARSAFTAPVLRFYHWTAGPAVTFGYGQFYGSVRAQTPPQAGPLCRRPTGGGMVFHGEDLTFSLVFQTAQKPKEIYAALHGAVERALLEQAHMASLRQGEVPASAYAPQQNGAAGGCFVNPVQDDLLVNGQKILGGAIRRFGSAVLYQGSLQCAGARTNPVFRRAICAGATAWLGVLFETRPAPPEILSAARTRAVSQYQTAAWNEKL